MTWQQGAWGAVVVCISPVRFPTALAHRVPAGPTLAKVRHALALDPVKLTWCGWGLLWLLLCGWFQPLFVWSRPPALALAIGAALTGTGGFRWFWKTGVAG